MKRIIFRSQFKIGQKENVINTLSGVKISEDIMTLSVFCWRNSLFLYYECMEDEVLPAEMLKELEPYLESWPGEDQKRYWIRMFDIFHYNQPSSIEYWKRKEPMQPWAQLIRIKPEKLSSYIFYHYQLQEERPGSGNKYGMIGMHENLLFFYLEKPNIIEEAESKGLLETKNTPPNWGELMKEHFMKWEDCSEETVWRNDLELIFHI